MNASLLDVLHDPGDHHITFGITKCINVELSGIVEVLVNKNWLLWIDLDCSTDGNV